MSGQRWVVTWIAAAVAFSAVVPLAGAQDGQVVDPPPPEVPGPEVPGPEDPTATSVPPEVPPPDGPPPEGPTTTLAPDEPGPGSTTSTSVPGDPEEPQPDAPSPVTIPPELADDPRAPVLYDPGPGDGGEAPLVQGVFDPSTNTVLEAKVAELRGALGAKVRMLSELQAQVFSHKLRLDELVDQLGQLDSESRANVQAAVDAERALRDHTVEAFVNGSLEDRVAMARTGDPVQMGVAREFLGSVIESDERLVAAHQETSAELDGRQAKLLTELTEAQRAYNEVSARFSEALQDALAEGVALKAFEAGAKVYVRGFVFPVAGDVEFIDSWGYPRMTGTAQAHWHQGTDVFAPMGTPLLAAESGELYKVGFAGLGGRRLWLKGDSGMHYYYAHLSGFAPGVVDGLRVNAGDVVGYVGDTGNARGTSPHLHIQMHPDGGDPINPYPMLRATFGNRPMVEIVQAPPPGVPPIDLGGAATAVLPTDPAAAPGAAAGAPGAGSAPAPPVTAPPGPDTEPGG